MYIPRSQEEKEFLENYDSSKYEKPSVTVDMVIFTLSQANTLSVLLIKRGGFPYRGCWAIPGGFVEMWESIDAAAARELKEETGISDLPMTQIGTFGEVDRDPRTRVISVVYMAFVPQSGLDFLAGDDASDAEIFEIQYAKDGEMRFVGDRDIFSEKDLAFDHGLVLRTAINRLRNRIDYTDDALAFLKDDQSFTAYELKTIFESVLGKKLDAANFRRDVLKKYISSGIVEETGETEKREALRPAKLYKRRNKQNAE